VRVARRAPLIAAAAVAALAVAGLLSWFVHFATSGRPANGEVLSCPLPAQDASVKHPGMVWVPGGSFDFGALVYPEEQPVRRIRVDGFWIDRTEVTNQQFAAFVQATGYVTLAEREVDAGQHPGLPPEMRRPGAVVFVSPVDSNGKSRGNVTSWWRYVPGAQWRHPGGPDTSIQGRDAFPVVAITYQDALAYARWKGRALPSEAQWEWAARAAQAQPAPEHEQPKQANTWQGLFPVLNSAEDGFTGLAPVGCYRPNALGLFDMIGNVWELTADAWTPSHETAETANSVSPTDASAALARPGAPAQRVIKGGSHLCAPNYCMRYRSGARQPQDEDLAVGHLGFRTLLLAPGP
jgi:sulfatase modifying factor 1